MIVKTIYRSAAGPAQWMLCDTKVAAFHLGLNANVTAGASLTYKVQYAAYDPIHDRVFSQNMVRSGTTLTIGPTPTPHGLSTLDSITVGAFGAVDGTYDVASVVDANNFTLTVANSGSTTPTGTAYYCKFHVADDTVIAAKTSSFSGSSGIPFSYVRLNITTYVSGTVTFTVTQSGGNH